MIYKKMNKSFGYNEVWATDAVNFLSTNGIPLISTVTGTHRDRMLQIIQDAIQEGYQQQLSTYDIVKLIETRLEDYKTESNFRADRIARTETVRGSNYGAMQGARALDFLVQKVWIAAMDNRTRPAPGEAVPYSHRYLNGKREALEQPFNNGEPIMQPGDPKASAANTINCRCVVAFEPIKSNGKNIKK
jgi:uncharacterized protein with gpF-like domain